MVSFPGSTPEHPTCSPALAALVAALLAGCGAGTQLHSASVGPGVRPRPLPRLTAGRAQSCLLDAEGSLTCWGSAAGDAPRGHFDDVAVGGAGGCAAGEDGVVCWGTSALADPPDVRLGRLAVGKDFACGLRADDGGVMCWGRDADLLEATPDARFEDIAAGRHHVCALDDSGAIRCWGARRRGQTSPPVGPFIAVGAGGDATCGIVDGGGLRCWGDGRAGLSEPPPGAFHSVSLGMMHGCALQSQGIARCWGDDGDRQARPPNGRLLTLASGDTHGCAIRQPGGELTCWGNDFDGAASPPASARRVAIPDAASAAHARKPPRRRSYASSEANEGGGSRRGPAAGQYGKLIVLGLRTEHGDDVEALGLSAALRAARPDLLGYEVSEEAPTADQAAMLHGCEVIDRKCMAAIATQFGAAAIVAGTLRRVDPRRPKQLIIELRLFESLSGDVSATTTEVAAAADLRGAQARTQAALLLRNLQQASRR